MSVKTINNITKIKDVEQGAINQTGGRAMSKPDTNQAIKLMQGDCLELMKGIPDGSIDMVLCDPPYGMAFQSGYRTIRYEKIKGDQSLHWLDDFVELFKKDLRLKILSLGLKTTHQWVI